MKKLILAGLMFTTGNLAWAAAPGVWRSSYTATADTTLNLCTNKRGMLHSVVVSSAGVGGTMTVYASSGTAIQPITVINSSVIGSYNYDVIPSTRTGLTYSTVGTAQVTILYDCH